MRTDTIFYELFLTLPGTLFEILGESAARAQHYQFTSIEVKQLAKRIDGLFLPTDDPPKQPIYFVEVQFQKDEELYDRLFQESSTYISQYQPDREWYMVAVWANRQVYVEVPIRYQKQLAAGFLKLIYLEDLEDSESSIGVGLIKLVLDTEAAAPDRVKQLFNQVQTSQTDQSGQRAIGELIEKVLAYKLPSLSRQELETMFTLTDWKQTRFYQEAFAEGQEELKVQSVARFLSLGLTIEDIARGLNLDISVVEGLAKSLPQNQTGQRRTKRGKSKRTNRQSPPQKSP